MSQYRTRNRSILMKVETTSGTDAAPTPANDAVLVSNPSMGNGMETFSPDEVTGSLDDRGDIPVGGQQPFTCTAFLKGSGSAAVAPELDAALQACAMGVQTTAAAVTGTAAAGSASSITLAAGASAVDGFYVGMPIQITAGTGSGQWRVIAAYVGSTRVATPDRNWSPALDATSVYSIPVNVLYRPISTPLKTDTIYDYRHRSDGGNSKLRAIVGAAGSFNLQLQARRPAQIDFSFMGKLVAPTDVAAPAAPVYDSTTAPPWIGATLSLGGIAVPVRSLTLDAAADVQSTDDPQATFGYGNAGVVARKSAGTLSVPGDLESVFNFFSKWQTGAQMVFSTTYGASAGNRLAITVPNLQVIGREDEDANGFNYDRIPYRTRGENAGFYICSY